MVTPFPEKAIRSRAVQPPSGPETSVRFRLPVSQTSLAASRRLRSIPSSSERTMASGSAVKTLGMEW
jgi:hypothetical protein